MTIEERIAALPRDRHVRYRQRRMCRSLVWYAFFKDDAGHVHCLSLGMRLPPGIPDWPCQHAGQLFTLKTPTNETERQALAAFSRRANALRKTRSNQYRKQREQQSA